MLMSTKVEPAGYGGSSTKVGTTTESSGLLLATRTGSGGGILCVILVTGHFRWYRYYSGLELLVLLLCFLAPVHAADGISNDWNMEQHSTVRAVRLAVLHFALI